MKEKQAQAAKLVEKIARLMKARPLVIKRLAAKVMRGEMCQGDVAAKVGTLDYRIHQCQQKAIVIYRDIINEKMKEIVLPNGYDLDLEMIIRLVKGS